MIKYLLETIDYFKNIIFHTNRRDTLYRLLRQVIDII